VEAVRRSPKPVIAAVNGTAAGGGMTLALAADIRLAEPGTQFLPAFAQVGLVPDSGAAHLLVRHLGLSRAMALALTGGRLSAGEAREAGLVLEVADSADGLLPLAERWAARLAALPPLAVSATKEVLQLAADVTFPAAVALETAHQARLGQTRDYREALRAFVEKRRPEFTGQ
jgi:2-(1,2-epoxy-1,2-dihydrophenyl)acetyl-CoA isomerase